MYDALLSITRFIDQFIIDRIHYTILFIILIAKIRKSIDKEGALQVLRFMMLGYSMLMVIELILPFISVLNIKNEAWKFLQSTNGWYFYSYLFMMLFKCFLPLILFSNKLASKTGILLFVGVLMNFGMIFESFVITVTSIHRDYPDMSDALFFVSMMILSAIICGIYSSAIAFSISWFYTKIKKRITQ